SIFPELPTGLGYEEDSLNLTKLGFIAKNNSFGYLYQLPLTKDMVQQLRQKNFILSINKKKERIEHVQLEDGRALDYPMYYPIDYPTKWTRDTYGPIWIPKRGATITFDKD